MEGLPRTLLIVDDEELVSDSLGSYFEALGCIVHTASSAEEALDGLAEANPDAAIVDMRLPGMSGQEFLLAARAKLPALKSLIYTGSLEYTLPQEFLALGMGNEHVFVKPVEDMKILADALVSLMTEK